MIVRDIFPTIVVWFLDAFRFISCTAHVTLHAYIRGTPRVVMSIYVVWVRGIARTLQLAGILAVAHQVSMACTVTS